MAKDFEFIEHTADIKIKVYGSSLKGLFNNALKALFQVTLPISKNCSIRDGEEVCNSFTIKRKISVVSANLESLLVDFLSEVLCMMDTYDEAYGDIVFSFLSEQEIVGTLKGVPFNKIGGEDIKAITYHELSIEKNDEGWQAIIVFDV